MTTFKEYTEPVKVKEEETTLRHRTPEEWVEAIKELPSELHPVIARIVWWDYFGTRISKDAWPHLDEMREKPLRDVTDKAQRDALKHLGYNPKVITKRVGPRRY